MSILDEGIREEVERVVELRFARSSRRRIFGDVRTAVWRRILRRRRAVTAAGLLENLGLLGWILLGEEHTF